MTESMVRSATNSTSSSSALVLSKAGCTVSTNFRTLLGAMFRGMTRSVTVGTNLRLIGSGGACSHTGSAFPGALAFRRGRSRAPRSWLSLGLAARLLAPLSGGHVRVTKSAADLWLST